MTHRVPIEGTLDLHAFAPRDIPSVVEEYITAAQAEGLDEVRLIHGRGVGVQRRTVHEVLRNHPSVAEFRDAPECNLGATIARLVSAGAQRPSRSCMARWWRSPQVPPVSRLLSPVSFEYPGLW